jgi:Tol biopolymer transport system component
MLPAGTRLGPYELIALVGEGGMGQVYKARDTRLDRLVAIKMLPAGMAADAQRRERFEREARHVSRLEHPHICPLYDVGEHEGHLYLVMQFLEGETLAERLTRGPLPVSQTLEYGIQIAEALAAAHRAGFVHRDLKPGNVMITRTGVRLLDFGLARAVPLPSTLKATVINTAAPSTLTTEGTILGTLSYMAPEQIDGREIDTRADIFAFGAVLFEMVTGLKAFEGETPARVISSILRDEPVRVSSIIPVTPAALEALIHACLAKDPHDRWQNIGDVARQLRHLKEMMSSGKSASLSGMQIAPPGVRATAQWRRYIPWAVAAAFAAIAGALFLTGQGRRSGTPPADALQLHAFILPPDGIYLTNTLALSPDARRLAFVAADGTGRRQLWIRDLNGSTARVIANTDNASEPFWSPDGNDVAFFAAGQLKRVPASGGAVAVICDSGAGAGGTWNRENVIVFSPLNGPLMRVAAGGGRPEPLTAFDRTLDETHHLYPSFLPDGQHFVFYVASRERGLYVGDLGSQDRRRLFDPDPSLPPGAAATPGIYDGNGRLLYVRDRVLTARQFDPQALTVAGEPATVVQTVDYDPPGQAAFTIASGVLVYRAKQHRPQADIAWVDRKGNITGSISTPPGTFRTMTLAADDRTLAIDRRDAQGLPSVWLVDVASGTSTRLPSTYWSGDPLWSPDGQRLAYSIADTTPPNLVVRDARGHGTERRLTRHATEQHYANSWTPDGRAIVFEAFSNDTGWDLQMVNAADAEAPTQRLLQTRAHETAGRVSPDGRWLAYESDESGRKEIYVAPFPELQGARAVSSGGGTRPFWRRDGRELFYLGPEGRVMAVSVTPGASLATGKPEELFRATLYGNVYVPTADGQRFLVARPTAAREIVPLEVLVNPFR